MGLVMFRAYRTFAALVVFLTLGLGSAFATGGSVTLGQLGNFGPAGWTTITPANDSVFIYVSSSTGNDANPGTAASPVATLAQAYTLAPSGGSPYWILMKEGDTWDVDVVGTNFFVSGYWGKPGRSASEPAVITTYNATGSPTSGNPRGSPRTAPPILRLYTSTNAASSAFWGTSGIDYVAFIGFTINFYKQNPADVGNYNPSLTLSAFSPNQNGYNSHWYLVEDVAAFYGPFGAYGGNGTLTGGGSPIGGGAADNVYIRRNITSESWGGTGIGMQVVFNALLEENVFYRNGWTYPSTRGGFSHGIYGQWTDPSVIPTPQNWTYNCNVVLYPSEAGLRNRQSGIIFDNLISAAGQAVDYGDGGAVAGATTLSRSINSNVVLDGYDGFGISITTVSTPLNIQLSGNLAANLNASAATNTAGFGLADNLAATFNATNFLEHWGTNDTSYLSTVGNTVTGPTVGTTVQRSLADYATYLHGLDPTTYPFTTEAGLIAAITANREYNYDGNFHANTINNWIRLGAGMPAVVIGSSPSPSGGHSWLGRFGMLKPANDNIAERLRKLSAVNDNLPVSVFKKVARR